jgi:hypothetical protein
MAPPGYDTVKRALEKLAALVPSHRTWAPLLTRAKVACDVGDDLVVYAVRAAARRDDDRAELRPLEAADVSGSGPVVFSPLTPALYNPAFPVIARRSSARVVGAVAAREVSEERLKLRSFEALLVRPGTGVQAPDPALDRVSDAVRIAPGSAGEVYVLAQGWYPPPSSPSRIPLRLFLHRAGSARPLADPVPGTDTPGSYPADAALHVSVDGRVHLVYDGLRPGMARGAAPHLFHLTLDATGALEQARDLGEAQKAPVASRIVASPDGRLFFVAIHLADGALAPRVVRLEAHDDAGAPEPYLIDPWLQPHAITFAGPTAEVYGPGTLPPKP